MMTKKLFENNSLLQSCTATVLSCLEAKEGFLVELDQTVFFPEGGGQLSDRGTLGGVAVTHVSEKEGHIYHHCTAALPVGEQVEAKLNWQLRLDRMQQHLGEHLLSYACWRLFQANNVGFHMNEDTVTIDLDKELTQEQLLKAELYTNEIIWENRPVTISYLDSSEAAKLQGQMRKFNNKLTGILRLVAVENADICTCCGTHPPFTGMVGTVKLIRWEKHKQGQRLEFLCGRRALLDADKKNGLVLQAAASLSAKPEQLVERLEKLKEESQIQLNDLRGKLAALQGKLLLQQAATAPVNKDGVKIVSLALENADGKDLKALLPVAMELENSLVLLLGIMPERISYVAVLGKNTAADCRQAMKALNEAFRGRGGGKVECAQGGSGYCSDWPTKLAMVEQRIC